MGTDSEEDHDINLNHASYLKDCILSDINDISFHLCLILGMNSEAKVILAPEV